MMTDSTEWTGPEQEESDLFMGLNSEELGMGLDGLEKAPLAFRTISEVADELQVPQHTLRLWEAQFQQVRPVKRAGGRRYYRQEDIALLRYIADLLYTQGYTAKGVQRLLDSGMAPPAPESTTAENAALETELSIQAPVDEAGADVAPAHAPVLEQPVSAPQESPAAVLQSGYERQLRAELEEILVELLAIRQKLVV